MLDSQRLVQTAEGLVAEEKQPAETCEIRRRQPRIRGIRYRPTTAPWDSIRIRHWDSWNLTPDEALLVRESQ